MGELEVPYGKGKANVEIPDGVSLTRVEPSDICTAEENLEKDYAVIQRAIESPISSKPLDEFLSERILVIVNDGTRATKTEKVLRVIYDMIKDKDIEFMVATGTHREATEEELKSIFGRYLDEFRDRISCHSALESETVTLGKTPRGTPVRVSKKAVDAGSIIAINTVEPHYFAGYTGGRKSILPGVSSFETIKSNHGFAMDPAADVLRLEDNPVHLDMEDAVRIFGKEKIFAINLVQNMNCGVYAAAAGDILEVQYALKEKADELFASQISEKADIVLTAASYPLDINFYQAHKAVEHGKIGLKDGGILILVSQCRDGIGSDKFYEMLSSEESMEKVKAKLDREYEFGDHIVMKFIDLMEKAKIFVVSDLEGKLITDIFMTPYNDVQKAIDDALADKGNEASLLFISDGSIMVPVLEK